MRVFFIPRTSFDFAIVVNIESRDLLMTTHKAFLKTALIVGSLLSPLLAAEADSVPQAAHELAVSAKQISCPIPGIICLRVSAINRSATQIYSINATDAVLANASERKKALPSSQICLLSDKQEWQRVRDEQAAVTIATAGLGTMVVGDIEAKKQNPQAWLGRTAEDRARTQDMFDERLILQLDHTDGLIYFNGGPSGTSTLRLQSKKWPDDIDEKQNANSEIAVDVSIDNTQVMPLKRTTPARKIREQSPQ